MDESNDVSITVSELPPESNCSFLSRFNSSLSEASYLYSNSSNMTRSPGRRSLKQARLDSWFEGTETCTQSHLNNIEEAQVDPLPPWIKNGRLSTIYTTLVSTATENDTKIDEEQFPEWMSQRPGIIPVQDQAQDLAPDFLRNRTSSHSQADKNNSRHDSTLSEFDLLSSQIVSPSLSLKELSQIFDNQTQDEISSRQPFSIGLTYKDDDEDDCPSVHLSDDELNRPPSPGLKEDIMSLRNTEGFLTFSQVYEREENYEEIEQEENQFSYMIQLDHVIENSYAPVFDKLDEGPNDDVSLADTIPYGSKESQDTVPYPADTDDNDTVPYDFADEDYDTGRRDSADTVLYDFTDEQYDTSRRDSADTVRYDFVDEYREEMNGFSVLNIPQPHQQDHTDNYSHESIASSTNSTDNRAKPDEEEDFSSLDLSEEDLLQLEKTNTAERSSQGSFKKTTNTTIPSTSNIKKTVPKKRRPSSSPMPVPAKHPLIRPGEKHVMKTTTAVKKHSTIIDYFQQSTSNISMKANDTQIEEEIGKESDVPYLASSLEQEDDVKKAPYKAAAATATDKRSQTSSKFVITRKKKPNLGLSKFNFTKKS